MNRVICPPGGFLKLGWHPGGDNSDTIASILLVSTTRTITRGEILKPRLGLEMRGKLSEGGQVSAVSCIPKSGYNEVITYHLSFASQLISHPLDFSLLN